MAEEWVENPSKDFQDRIAICKKCPEFFEPSKTCKQCYCFMFIKARLNNATCPLGKW